MPPLPLGAADHDQVTHPGVRILAPPARPLELFPRPSRTQEQLLCDSVVFYAVMHLFASELHVARYLRFADFIDGVEYPSSDVIAPLCLFAPHDGRWGPAAVVACVPDGSPGRAGGKTQYFL